MTVTEYEREFVRLSKYARQCVSTKVIMCKRACKAEELVKEKRKAEIKSHDLKKRKLGKSYQSSSKKSREFTTRSATSAGFSIRSKGKQYLRSKPQTTSVASIGNARPSRQECPQCGRRHPDEYRANERSCFNRSFY
ncbi:Gag-Pol polyprotein [Gossypium australe]|uniref:Gag-Pol polyprotein n=1 Tax=Gossypium australe TaxID=47621 RepID=A0A5B6V9Q9_9ROSI|nr:Gag-Pol polyprotein [Gossypium australe]